MSWDSLYNVDFLKGISHPTLFFPQLTSISEVTSGTIDVPTQPPIELHTIHHVFLFCLYMIIMKEKRDLFGILNYANCILPYVCFTPSCNVFYHKNRHSQVVDIIKKPCTVFDEPIALLCKEANLAKHFKRMLKATKAIVKVCSIFPILLLIFPFYFYILFFTLFYGTGKETSTTRNKSLDENEHVIRVQSRTQAKFGLEIFLLVTTRVTCSYSSNKFNSFSSQYLYFIFHFIFYFIFYFFIFYFIFYFLSFIFYFIFYLLSLFHGNGI